MKRVRKISVLIMLSVVVCLSVLTTGCNSEDNDDLNADFFNYALVGVDESWRGDIVNCLKKVYDEDTIKEVPWEAFAVALFDITLDGKPEFIKIEAGGSAGNFYCTAYDLTSMTEIGSFDGGHFGNDFDGCWCTYYDYSNNTIRNISYESIQAGYNYPDRLITGMKFDRENNTIERELLFGIGYVIDNDTVIEANYVVNGNSTEPREFHKEYQLFIDSIARLSPTGMQFVYWNDVPNDEDWDVRVNNMADALMALDQKFVVKK